MNLRLITAALSITAPLAITSPLAITTLLAGTAPAIAATTLPVPPMTRPQARVRAAGLQALGKALFFDPALSASGRMSCASCHDPAHGFTPANARPVQFGGGKLDLPGVRAVPTLGYLQSVPSYTEHFFDSDEEGDESVDNGPTGGLTWDGRAGSGHVQARIPLLSPQEMANPDPQAVAERVLRQGFGPRIAQLFGPAIARDPAQTFEAVTEAIEAFEQTPEIFYPYTSKYDAYLHGRATLSRQEAAGLAAFDDPARGNCASCHISKPAADGSAPFFTDFGMIALGVPRNPGIEANRDPAYFDLGLCGPYRTDLAAHADDCGRFRTPTLRNVALKRRFMHNGMFDTLGQVVAFYATRDTDPARWYPRGPSGKVVAYDDMPAADRANVNREAPFGGSQGAAPHLNQAEIDDVVAFMNTLTDGWRPPPPQPPPQPPRPPPPPPSPQPPR